MVGSAKEEAKPRRQGKRRPHTRLRQLAPRRPWRQALPRLNLGAACRRRASTASATRTNHNKQRPTSSSLEAATGPAHIDDSRSSCACSAGSHQAYSAASGRQQAQKAGGQHQEVRSGSGPKRRGRSAATSFFGARVLSRSGELERLSRLGKNPVTDKAHGLLRHVPGCGQGDGEQRYLLKVLLP